MAWLQVLLACLCHPAAERLHSIPQLPDCSGGVVHLDGTYRTTAVVEYTEDCVLKGAPGSEVHVQGEIHFLKNARLEGSIIFRRARDASEGHRCVDVEGSLEFVNPDIEFLNCGSKETDDGGALYVEGPMNISNGSVTFRNGTAKWGGCLAVVKDITMEGGEVVFEDCHATHAGGGAWLHNNLLQLGGHIRFHNCSAQYGGGLTVTTGSIRQLYGNMSLHSCVSHLGRGGGIYVEEQFLEQRGRLEVTNCGILGFGDGGAVRAEAYMGYGEARFEGCFADHGGAMSLEELRHHKGNMSFVNCRAASAGGAVHTFRLRQESDLTECTSSWRRHRDRRARNRCILFKKMKSLARMSFASCSAPRGGAVNVYSLRQKGRMSFQECRAETGGAVDMTGTHFGKVSLKQLNRPVFRGGGGVDFHGCTANTGGALHSPGDVLLKRGAVYTFRDLFAAANGGAMVARTLRSAAQAQFVNVTSKTGNTIATRIYHWNAVALICVVFLFANC